MIYLGYNGYINHFGRGMRCPKWARRKARRMTLAVYYVINGVGMQANLSDKLLHIITLPPIRLLSAQIVFKYRSAFQPH